MDSNYYDEQRMDEEMNNALGYSYESYNENFSFELKGGITEDKLKLKIKDLIPVTLEDLKKIKAGTQFENVQI